MSFKNLNLKILHSYIKNFNKTYFYYFVVFLLLIILPKRYEANDDIYIDLLSSGYYTGTAESSSLFSHYLLGEFLSFFYKLLPNFNIFNIFNILILLISTNLFIWIALKETVNSKFLIIIILGFYSNCLMQINFSIVAFIGGYSSILYLFNYRKTKFDIYFILAIILLVISICIRQHFFLLAFFLNLPFILRQFVKDNKRILFLLSLIASANILLFYSNNSHFKSDNKWSKNYDEYKLQSSLADNPCFNNFYIKPYLKEIGWSENDLKMYLEFYFDIPKNFDNKGLLFINKVLPNNPLHFNDFVLSLIDFIPWYILLLVVFSLVYTYKSFGLNQLVYLIIYIAIILFFLKFLTGSKNIFKERFLFSILFGVCFNSYFSIYGQKIEYKISRIYLLIPIILMFLNVIFKLNLIKKTDRLFQVMNKNLIYIGKNKCVFDYYHSYPIQSFENFKNSKMQLNRINFIPNGWINNTPAGLIYLEKLGFNSLITAISDKNTIHLVPKYFIENYKKTFKQYFKEKLNKEIEFNTIDSFKSDENIYFILQLTIKKY